MLPEKMQAARLKLVRQYPFLASALWSVIPIEKPGLGTLAVDKWWRLYFDPVVVQKWTVEELSAVLYHEACHLLRDHASRFENAVQIVANLAGDIEINDDIRAEVQLPGGAIYPETFELPPGKLAEEYYDELAKRLGTAQAGSSGDAGGQESGDGSSSQGHPQQGAEGAAEGAGDGSKPTDPSSSGSPASSNPSGSPVGSGATGHGDKDHSHAPSPFPGAGRCGSCAHGQQESWEEGPPGQSKVPGISSGEAEVIRRKVAEDVIRIDQSSDDRGTVPEHWRRWADQKLRPKVDWRKELASLVRRAIAAQSGASDYTYRRPSKRSPPGIILPSLYQPVPEVAVVVDTSGSISDNQIAQALAEVAGVLQALGYRNSITVLSVDAEVHTCQRVFRPEQVKLVGGGGTDMGVGLDAALRLRPRPEVVIIITDGLTPWPDKPPTNTSVVVALVGNGQSPDWAKTVRAEVNQ